MTVRRLLRWALSLAFAPVLANPFMAFAEDAAFPSRPITMVVGFGAGGGTDTAARLIAKNLSAELQQTVIVENRAGAGGTIGAASVVKAPADGLTLFFGSGSELTVLPVIRKQPPYDTLRHFEPISLVGKVSFMLVAHPSVQANTVAELLAQAKSKPGAMAFASYGIGSTNHLIGELFASKTGTQLLHVPYKGSAAAATDLMSGQVQIAFDTVSVMLPHVQAGRLKAFGILSPSRSQLAPDLPTMAEAGVPDLVVEGWMGVLAPAGTPRAVTRRLSDALSQVLKNPETVEALRQRGVAVSSADPQQFRDFIGSELERWRAVAKSSAIQVD